MQTSEAEYMTITHAWRDVKRIRSLLTEMGFGYMVKEPTPMIGDNQNATNWAVEKMITDGNKHIDISYMKIREVVKKGEILPMWVKGEFNPADLLTKVVTKKVIEELRELLHGLKPIDKWTTRVASELTRDRKAARARYALHVATRSRNLGGSCWHGNRPQVQT